MSAARMRAVAIAGLLGSALVALLVVGSDHQDGGLLWAVFGPAILWSFVGTGLYASHKRPESRTGELMVWLGFAWVLSALTFANDPTIYTFGMIAGGLWGGVFLQLVVTFPTGRIQSAADRWVVWAGYLLFTLGTVPAMLFAAPDQLGCDTCPDSVLLVRRDEDLASVLLGLQAVAWAVLFVVVLVRLAKRWRATEPLARLQLTPVYACGLLTFLLATVATAGGGAGARWAALIATVLLPFALLGGLLRSHVAQLDEELRDRLEELRASRQRLVEAGDAERRRLERDLHDGAQSRLVGVALLLGQLRPRVAGDPTSTELLERAHGELTTGLAELRELARGIHPAVLTERGLEPALTALVTRAPVPVALEADGDGRLPPPVESAAYFVVSEALTNVVKYAHATHASVAVRHGDGRVTIEVADDGVGGADAGNGSGLRGLTDRVAALDGTLTLESPPGGGTRLRVEMPL
jgi:signal transduction histidine kinase